MTVKKNNMLNAAIAMALGGMFMTAQVSAVEFGVFGDASWSKSDAPGASSAFAIGGLDMYARQQIDPKTVGFIEYVFENDGESFVLDLERLYIERDVASGMKVGMGRFHSPLGFWNNNYHHGVMIQDTVSRPSFLDFEDGGAAILPTHVIGATLQGEAGPLDYQVSMANSTFLDSSDIAPEIGIGNVFDLSDDKTLFARGTFDVAGANLGVSYMKNSIVEAAEAFGGVSAFSGAGIAAGDEIISQTVIGVDGRYSVADVDLLGEMFMMTNQEATGVDTGKSHSATAMYLQASYQVNDKLRPTYRYESLAFDQAGVATDADEYFNILGREEYSASVIAVRYDLDESNALTFEYLMKDFTNRTTDASETVMTLDWSFLMF